MRVFCINLPTDAERRKNVQDRCAEYGIVPEIIEAVHGNSLGEEEVSRLIYAPTRNTLTRGEIGCALSHMKVYERILAEGCDTALVLEDDIRFKEDPSPFLESMETADPDRPDVFLFTENKQYRANKGRTVGSVTFYPALNANCAHAYGITRAAAKNMLDYARPIRAVADSWKHFILCGIIQVWVCQNSPFVPLGNIPSTIELERALVKRTPERRAYHKSLRSLIPLNRRFRYYLWKTFLCPFEKITHVSGGKDVGG